MKVSIHSDAVKVRFLSFNVISRQLDHRGLMESDCLATSIYSSGKVMHVSITELCFGFQFSDRGYFGKKTKNGFPNLLIVLLLLALVYFLTTSTANATNSHPS